MKKTFKNVHINENGEVFNKINGFKISPLNGLYPVAGKYYTQDEVKNIYFELPVSNPIKIDVATFIDPVVKVDEPKIPPKEIIRTQHATNDRNTQKDSIETRKEANETRKPNKARLGTTNGKSIGAMVIEGKRYESAHQAAKELNLSPSTILRRCKAGVNGYSIE